MNFQGPLVRERGRALLAPVLALAVMAMPVPAGAYDPATTHAGLTEQAALASSLHRLLSTSLGRPLGLLEPLQIHARTLPAETRRELWGRLAALDPAGGYRPDAEGDETALAWLLAGSVLAKTPPERGRHHFLDPRRRAGLDDAPGLAGFAHAVRLSLDRAATVRDIATGNAFDLRGQPSLSWIDSSLNDQSLPAFHRHWERAVSAPESDQRESELVRALIALGGILTVLEDAGEPAFVRNDFRAAFLRRRGPSTWDCASPFERFVAERYGRTGVPAPRSPVRRPTLTSYFTAPDGEGLADRTQRRFFSEGTLPEDGVIEPRTTTRDIVEAAREQLAFPLPTIATLDLRAPGRRKYLLIEGRRALGYMRVPGRVRFFLDQAVYADAARVLLPEIAAHAAGLLDHLLRARLSVTIAGAEATIALEGASGAVSEYSLRVFAEDARGHRRELAVPAHAHAGVPPLTVTLPAGARKLAAVARGRDAAGVFVAAGESFL